MPDTDFLVQIISDSRRRTSTPSSTDAGMGQVFARAISAIRRHLGMDIAFISEFADGRRYFRHVDAASTDCPVQVGKHDPLEESLCLRVVDGRVPRLIADASSHEVANVLPVLRALPVGAHLSVPILLSDGRVFGTFCCFSALPDHSLNDRDLDMMCAFAEVVADLIEQERVDVAHHRAASQRIASLLESSQVRSVYQPIVDLLTGCIAGFEALSRFDIEPQRGPDVWFAEAASIGRGVELETLAIRRALQGLDRLPDTTYLSLNASPATLINGRLEMLLRDVPLERVIIEITEHEAVDKYGDLLAAVQPLQARGLRIAIDDAGAGYASFRHILNLAPYMIKLDVSITRGIDTDRSRQALAAALSSFARATDAKLVAEGIECEAELLALRRLGISKGQGYFLGRPVPLPASVAATSPRKTSPDSEKTI